MEDDNFRLILEKAETEYTSRHFGKARDLFHKAIKLNPDSIQAKSGLIISLIQLKQFKDAEGEIARINESELAGMDELFRFRIVFSKIRLYQFYYEIDPGMNYLESWISHFSKINQTIIQLEKAEFLVLGGRIPEARSIVLEGNKNLQDKARIDNLGRLLFLFMQINEWDLARKILIESFKSCPTFGKLLSLAFLSFFTNPNYSRVVLIMWLFLCFIIPINNISIIRVLSIMVILGVVTTYFIIKGKGIVAVFIILFAIATLSFYYLKEFDVTIQRVTWTLGIILFIFIMVINRKKIITDKKTMSNYCYSKSFSLSKKVLKHRLKLVLYCRYRFRCFDGQED